MNNCTNCNAKLKFNAFFACEFFPLKCRNCGFIYYRKYRALSWVSFFSLLFSPLLLVIYIVDAFFMVSGVLFLGCFSFFMDVKFSPLIFISKEDYRIKNKRKDKRLLMFLFCTAVLFYLVESGVIG